jgi:hypothetical protein
VLLHRYIVTREELEGLSIPVMNAVQNKLLSAQIETLRHVLSTKKLRAPEPASGDDAPGELLPLAGPRGFSAAAACNISAATFAGPGSISARAPAGAGCISAPADANSISAPESAGRIFAAASSVPAVAGLISASAAAVRIFSAASGWISAPAAVGCISGSKCSSGSRGRFLVPTAAAAANVQ